jgi:hypothetical protein
MSPLYTFNGLILRVANALAAGPSCCCNDGECCEYNLALSYTVVYNGPEGVRTLSGLGPIIFDAGSIATFDCTPAYDCETGNFIDLELVLNFTLLNTFPPKSYFGYVDALVPGSSGGGVPCDEQISMDGLTFNLVYCVSNVPISTATATVTLNP